MRIFRYIIKSHLSFIVLFCFIISSLLSAIFLVELLRIPDKPSDVWELMFWKFPSLLSFSISFSVFAGIFVSYYIMKIKNELVAFPSIGFDGRFLMKNSIPIFLLLSLFHFAFTEGVVVKAERRFLEIKEHYKEGIHIPRTDYWTKRKNYIFHFGGIFPDKRLILDADAFLIEDGRMKAFIKAKKGTIYEDRIVMEDVKIYREGFPAESTDIYEIFSRGFLFEKTLSESEIFALSISELYKMRKILKKEGLDTSLYRNFIYTKLLLVCFSFAGGIFSIGIPYLGRILTFSPFLRTLGLFFLFLFSVYLTLGLSLRGTIHPGFAIGLMTLGCGLVFYYFLKKSSYQSRV